MSFQYTLTEVKPLGENDAKYGQRWWGAALESDLAISFNTLEGSFAPGDLIECDETVNKRSGKGTDYIQLKKVHLVTKGALGGSPESPGSTTIADPVSDGFTTADREQLQRIEDAVNQLLGL